MPPSTEDRPRGSSDGGLVYFTHDVRYLYAGLRALLEVGGSAETGQLVGKIGESINRYNERRALDFQLVKQRPVREEVTRDVVGELCLLGVFEQSGGVNHLTESGQELARLYRGRESAALKESFLRVMFSHYPEMTSFLWGLYKSGTDGLIEFPLVSSRLVNEQAHGDTRTLADLLSQALAKGPNRLGIPSEDIAIEIERRLTEQPNKLKATKSAVDTLVIRSVFGSDIQSRRKFDVLRSREQFFDLVNHGTSRSADIFVDQTYLTSWIQPGMIPPHLPGNFMEIDLDGRSLRIHVMEDTHATLRDFEISLKAAYQFVPRSQGFALAPDLRDFVCRQLRISGESFSGLFETLHRLKPDVIKLDYSFDVFTRRRMPLRMSADGGLYNLVKITSEAS